MKICAVIAEFNPLHNGHQYLLNQARIQTKCDAVLVILGSNFTQRGEPALLSKVARAKQAMLCGADIVVELPVYGSTLSAQDFAYQAVKIAHCFNHVTHLAFGSESGDIISIQELAQFLTNEPAYFKTEISAALDQGHSLPTAKSRALSVVLDERFKSFSNPETVSELLSKPNNILGVEYVKSLIKLGSKITPVAIKRMNNENKIEPEHTKDFASASAIRQALYLSGSTNKARKLMPKQSAKVLEQQLKLHGLPNQRAYSDIALGFLRARTPNDLNDLYDMAEGLNNKLISTSAQVVSFDGLVTKITSKRYTSSRIRRLVLINILRLKQSVVDALTSQTIPAFVKILAVKEDNKLLKQLTANCPVVLRHNDTSLITDELSLELIRADTTANGIYATLLDLNETQLQTFLNDNSFYAKTVFIKPES